MKTVCLVLFFGILLRIEAQEPAKEKKTVDLFWQVNATNISYRGNFFNDFVSKKADSPYLYNQKSNEFPDGSSYINAPVTLFSIGIGGQVSKLSLKCVKTTWRISGDYFKNISFGGFSHYQQFKHIDSTYYPEYNGSLIKDSIYSQNRSVSVKGKFTQLKTDLVFRIRDEKRFSFFTGIGFGIGITSQITSTIRYEEKNEEEVRFLPDDVAGQMSMQYNQSPTFFNPATTFSVNQKEKPIFSPFAYIPYGIDWQIGKKNNFTKQIHLYYEGQIGARFKDAYLGTRQTNLYLSSAVGFRVTI
jgi:hypothetical protein